MGASPGATESGWATRAAAPGWLYATLVILVAALYLPWLGFVDLLVEEPRRALIARTMLESGDFLVPRLGGEIYTAKPPLFNWAVAGLGALSGVVNEWSARLPSVLATLTLALILVHGTRRELGRPGRWFLGLSLVLAPEILAKGTLAEIEMLFTLLVAASLWSWHALWRAGHSGWRLWLAPLLLVALAYLAKREPAVLFFYLGVVPYLALRGRWRELFGPGHLAAFGAFVLVVGGWLSLVAAQVGWEALWATLQREVLSRGVSAFGWRDLLVHVLLYPLELLAALLPFSLLLPPLLSRRVRGMLRERYGELAVFAGVALVANLPLYWLRGDASVRYFLPMFPFALLLAALVFDAAWTQLGEWTTAWRTYLRRVSLLLYWLIPALVLLLVATTLLPRHEVGRFNLLPEALVYFVATAALAAAWLDRGRPARQPVAVLLPVMVGLVVLGRMIYFNALLPDKAFRAARDHNAPAIAATLARSAAGQPVQVWGEVPWAIWYYAPPGLLERSGQPPRPGLVLYAGTAGPAGTQPVLERFRYKTLELTLASWGVGRPAAGD